MDGMAKATALREAGGRCWTSVALVLATTVALIGAACTPPPPSAGTDVVMSASQQPDGLANYEDFVVLNTRLPDASPGSWLDVVDASTVSVYALRSLLVADAWSIECSESPTDNGDGSFSCPAELRYLRSTLDLQYPAHVYAGQGLLSTWPDTSPRLAAYIGTTTYSHSISAIGGWPITDQTRVGQTWTEQLAFRDGDDTVEAPSCILYSLGACL